MNQEVFGVTQESPVFKARGEKSRPFSHIHHALRFDPLSVIFRIVWIL